MTGRRCSGFPVRSRRSVKLTGSLPVISEAAMAICVTLKSILRDCCGRLPTGASYSQDEGGFLCENIFRSSGFTHRQYMQ